MPHVMRMMLCYNIRRKVVPVKFRPNDSSMSLGSPGEQPSVTTVPVLFASSCNISIFIETKVYRFDGGYVFI